MNTFGFIGHYLSLEHMCTLVGPPGRVLRRLPRRFLKRLVGLQRPFTAFRIPPHRSPAGGTARGCVVIAPILPEHIVTWGEGPVLRKVAAAVRLARRRGALLVGLGGFTSIVGNEGEQLARELPVALTSGNTLTAALALRGIREAAARVHLQLERATVAVIGATGDIGSACTRVLAREAAGLRLAARNDARLHTFAASLAADGTAKVEVVRYVRDAIREADVILTATSAVTTLIAPEAVKPGAVVCDVALPHNVGSGLVRARDDVLVFEGGMAQLPEGWVGRSRAWSQASPDGRSIFGCLAETMVLAHAGRLESYSLGRGRITPERVAEIETLATDHGFGLAPFRYGETVFDEARIETVRRAAGR
jgi:predicted amino acid dehydrogenase